MTCTVNGIVAGYDGSPASQEALGWAAWEARAHGVALTVCHVWGRAVPSDAAADLAWKYGECVMARGGEHAQATLGAREIRPPLASGAPAGGRCGTPARARL